MLYYLYNDYRESVLFDINSRLRTEVVQCNKVKLSCLSTFNLEEIGKDDILIITGCSIPSSTHDFKTDNLEFYERFLLSFNKKIILFEDIHDYTYGTYDNLFNDLKKYNIKNGTSMYECEEWEFIKNNYEWDNTFILTQHYESKTFNNKNLKKDIDVLLYGDVSSLSYPLRYKIMRALRFSKKLKVKIIKRAGYYSKNYESINNHRKELSELINRSHICIATSSKFNYFVCKYLEIASSNSVCAGNMEEIGKKIFGDNYIELNLNMSNYQIEKKLVEVLKDKQKLDVMKANVNKNISNLTIENNYWENLENIVKKI